MADGDRVINLGFMRITLPAKKRDPLDEAAAALRNADLMAIREGRKGRQPSVAALEEGKRQAKTRAQELAENRSSQREHN